MAETRTAEARRIVAAQRLHIANLRTMGGRTLEAEQTLSTYESSLGHLEDPASDTLTKSL